MSAGFLGGVAADEPRAAIWWRAIFSQAGGSAVDAASGWGLHLERSRCPPALGWAAAVLAWCWMRSAVWNVIAIVLPSRDARTEIPLWHRPSCRTPDAMARGLFGLHTQCWALARFEDLIRPAEDLARLGTEISRTCWPMTWRWWPDPCSNGPAAPGAIFGARWGWGAETAVTGIISARTLSATLAQTSRLGTWRWRSCIKAISRNAAGSRAAVGVGWRRSDRAPELRATRIRAGGRRARARLGV